MSIDEPGSAECLPRDEPVDLTDEPPPAQGRRGRQWPILIGFSLLALQLVAMFLFSWVQYQRYGLTNDFGGYAQAWHLIGHGHLDPYVTVFRVHFLHNNLDLAMYPLALIGRIIDTPAMLSWAQDAAVVATEAVVLAWTRSILQLHRSRLGRLGGPALVMVGVLLAANPWSWETAAFSLHFEAFATFFAVLVARDIWQSRYGLLPLWAVLAIGSESLGSLYLIAVGAAAAVSRSLGRRDRVAGLLTATLGVIGLVAVSSLHLIGRGGTTFNSAYAYLLKGHSGSIGPLTLLAGLATHLPSATTQVFHHLPYVVGYVVAGGTIGLFTSWGLAAVLVIIVPNALSGELPFIAFPGAFQSWPAEPFLVVGSVLAFVGYLSRRPPGFRLSANDRRLLALVLAPALTLSVLEMVTLPKRWMTTSEVGQELATIDSRIPPSAEVVANQNDIGRFALGRTAYDYVKAGDVIPLTEETIVVIARKIPDPSGERIVEDLTTGLTGARTIFEGKTFRAQVWSRPAGVTSLRI
jgi:hypothetical protein